MNEKRLMLIVPQGTHVRDLLMAGVVRRWTADPAVRLCIVSPYADDPDFVARFGGPSVSFSTVPWFANLSPWYWRVRRLFADGTGKVRLVLRPLWRRVAAALTPAARFKWALIDFRPDLVVTPTAHKPYDIAALLAARRAGVATAAIIASWDNLKYKLGDYPDNLYVWNGIMKEEAIRDHGYAPERVHVVGTPYSDYHVRPDAGYDRRSFLRELGLDPAKRLIVIGTAPHTSVCDHRFLIETIARARANGRLVEPCEILVRLHPVESRDFYGSMACRGEVHWDVAKHSFWEWQFGEAEVTHLRRLLTAADVMVNVASTITLEAALLDRPVINIGYHPTDIEDFRAKVLINHHQSHYKHVLARNGVKMAWSERELIDAINAYLTNPSTERQGRQAIARDLFDVADGRRAAAIADDVLRRLRTTR